MNRINDCSHSLPKKVILILALGLFVLGILSNAPVGYAGDACDIAGVDDPLICGTPNSNEEAALQNTVKNVLDTVYLWVGILAVIVIVIGGIRYMTSTGDEQKIKGAKNTITYATVGLVVTLAAFAITNFVIGALDGQTSPTTAEGGAGGASDVVKVKSIQTIGSLSLVVGQKYTIAASVIPDYATHKQLSFTSNNPSIATIDQNGNLEAKKDGKTTVVVASSDGPKKTVSITVRKATAAGTSGATSSEPTNPTIKPTSSKITLSANKVTLNLSDGKYRKTLKATVTSEGGNSGVVWTSSDPSIASVDENGKITAHKVGKVKITATTVVDKSVKAKAKIKVVPFDMKHAKKQHQSQLHYYNGYGNGNWNTCGPTAMIMAINIVTKKNHSQKSYYDKRDAAGMWKRGGPWSGHDASPMFNSFHKKNYNVSSITIKRKLKAIRKILDAGGVVWLESENTTKDGKHLDPWRLPNGKPEGYQHEALHAAIIWRHYYKKGKEYFTMKHSGVNNGKYTASQLQDFLDSAYGIHGSSAYAPGDGTVLRTAVYGVFSLKNPNYKKLK